MSNFFGLTGIYSLFGLIITITILSITIIIVVIILLKAFGRYKNINLLQGRIKLSSGDKEEAKERYSCYTGKCHPQKLSYIIMKTIDTHAKIKNLKESIYDTQKLYLQQKLELVRENDIKNYLSLLKNHMNDQSEDEILKTDAFQSYVNIIYRVYNNTMNLFKVFLKENNFEKYWSENNHKDWEQYKNDRIESLISRMNMELDVAFTPCHIPVTREQIHEKSKEYLSGFIRSIFNDIFEKAKIISMDIDKQINDIQKDFDEFAQSLAGSFVLIDNLRN